MTDFDVAILGGGPAGSALASYLAPAGVRCVVLERARFPRAHVGESLVPASTRVFREIGFLPQMDALGFVRKYGATWSSGSKTRPYQVDWQGLEDDCHAAIRFDERPQEGVEQNYTYHVDRARFDHALLDHAASRGAEVRQETRVERVDFDGPAPRVKLAGGDVLSARLVADCTGRHTLLGRQLGLKELDPVFDQYAIHCWYEGFDRDALVNPDHIHIHFLADRLTWIWQIPISETVTSIGVVTQKKHFASSRASRQAFFERCVHERPDLGRLVDAATRATPLKEEGDYSYAMRQFAGDGYVLLGDAARFVDPIFSSGVSVALSSARFASADIQTALGGGSITRDAFATYEATMRRGVRTWYEFIRLYYRLNVLFTAFIRDPAYRLDVLKLLQGDVYDEEPPAVLARMREKLEQVEENPNHMWHRMLGALSSDGLGAATELS